MHFTNFGLNDHIIKAIAELGFSSPTEIQKETIPLLLKAEKDLIGLAQTGTGKTAAFGLPLIQLVDVENRKKVQALVLCPTRELCVQITNELIKYSKYIPDISITPIYGGTDIKKQVHALKRGAHIVVGTPGRILDHLDRRTIDFSSVEIVVLDEADEMLTMGFHEDIKAILSTTVNRKRTWLFSATMPPMVENIAKKYMVNPTMITIGSKNSGAHNITHAYCVTRHQDRYEALRRFIDYYPDFFGIVFCRTRSETKDLADKLMRDGYDADALHGDLSQAQRDAVMQKLRHRKVSIVIATDVAARGIDISDITHVLHYNLPEKFENYTHRSGRTARAGKSGMSIVFVGANDVRRIKQIERIIGNTIEHIQVPNGNAICARQIEHCAQKITTTASMDKNIEPYIHQVLEKLEHISKQDLIAHIIASRIKTMVHLYKDAPDINDNANRSYNSYEAKPYQQRNDSRRPYRNFNERRKFNNNFEHQGAARNPYRRSQSDVSKAAPVDHR